MGDDRHLAAALPLKLRPELTHPGLQLNDILAEGRRRPSQVSLPGGCRRRLE